MKTLSLKLHHVPVIIFLTLPITLSITLYLSYVYYDDHVTYFLPYISDTGTYPPESCIFAQVLNCMVILMSFVMYIKYLQVKEIYKKYNLAANYRLNKIAFLTGITACFGVQIVANFQETNCLIVHWIGASFCFGFGAIYQCLQTVIYLKISPIIGQAKLTIFRICLTVISSVTFIIFIVAAIISFHEFKGNDFTKWKAEDGGYLNHQISTNSEWICATATMTYILLLYGEFKNISMKSMKICVSSYHPKSANKPNKGVSTISVGLT